MSHPLPVTMLALISGYEEEGNVASLTGLRKQQVDMLAGIAAKKHLPENLDRSWTMKLFTDYYQTNLACIDRALERLKA